MSPQSKRSKAKAADAEAQDSTTVGQGSAAVATLEQNDALEHTEGGRTTRSDRLDAGVPMQAGSPDEPVGPEDAFGDGPKRGDYTERTVVGPHLESVTAENAGEPIRDDDGNIVDYEPRFELQGQVPKAAEQGDVEGKKGGVETAGETA